MSLNEIDINAGWLTGTVAWRGGRPQSTAAATTLVRFIRMLNALLPIADQGYERLIVRASSAEAWQKKDMVGWIPIYPRELQDGQDTLRNLTPNVHYYATQLVDLEDTRRQARIALGLRRFANKHRRWPEQLSELQAFGVNDNELRTVDGTAFTMQSDDRSLRILGNQSQLLFSLDATPAS